MSPPAVRRTRDGAFEVSLRSNERDVLRALPGQLREILDSDDPAVERLFPPGYPEDPDRDEEYRRLTRQDLVAGRRTALEVMERTLDARRLDEEELVAWMEAVNDFRLVLGTKLDVTEDTDFDRLSRLDPRAVGHALYAYLTWLEDQIVAALANGIDPAGSEVDADG